MIIKIGLNLKIDQTENLNEDLKNENQNLKLYLNTYKEKCDKVIFFFFFKKKKKKKKIFKIIKKKKRIK